MRDETKSSTPETVEKLQQLLAAMRALDAAHSATKIAQALMCAAGQAPTLDLVNELYLQLREARRRFHGAYNQELNTLSDDGREHLHNMVWGDEAPSVYSVLG